MMFYMVKKMVHNMELSPWYRKKVIAHIYKFKTK